MFVRGTLRVYHFPPKHNFNTAVDILKTKIIVIEDNYCFGVNTKYISLSAVKKSVFFISA